MFKFLRAPGFLLYNHDPVHFFKGFLMPAPIITIANLSQHNKVPVCEAGLKAATRSHFKRSYNTVTAVDGISFSIDFDEVIGFLGPNGAGKTTSRLQYWL
jgi:ABC-type glutathione transport system ATPase component